MTSPTRHSCLQKFFGATSERLLKVFSRDFGYTPRSKSAPVYKFFSSRRGQTRGRGVRVRKHSRPPRRSSPHDLQRPGTSLPSTSLPVLTCERKRRAGTFRKVPSRRKAPSLETCTCRASSPPSGATPKGETPEGRSVPQLPTSAPAPFPYPKGTRGVPDPVPRNAPRLRPYFPWYRNFRTSCPTSHPYPPRDVHTSRSPSFSTPLRTHPATLYSRS